MITDAREKGSALDIEWLQLVLQAKQLGLSLENIREFLKQASFTTQSSPIESTD